MTRPGSRPSGDAGEPTEPARPRRLGRYELLERIGKGGRGVVYRARESAPRRWRKVSGVCHSGV